MLQLNRQVNALGANDFIKSPCCPPMRVFWCIISKLDCANTPRICRGIFCYIMKSERNKNGTS